MKDVFNNEFILESNEGHLDSTSLMVADGFNSRNKLVFMLLLLNNIFSSNDNWVAVKQCNLEYEVIFK